MNKSAILKLIIKALEKDLNALESAVKTARDSATHAESKAENKYDTRGLEASYLAHGQAQRAAEIATSLVSYQALLTQPSLIHSQVKISSLLQLEDEGGVRCWFWLGSDEGGLRVCSDGEEITVVTPQSPLGNAILGKQINDVVFVKINDQIIEYELVSLQ